MSWIMEKYPLHLLVWHNHFLDLDRALRKNKVSVELLDPRGRSPLQLAVCLGHLESARVLLRHGADLSRESQHGWTVLQEAVSTGDPELVQLVLQFRDYQRATERLGGIPELLSKLLKARDFYVEMKWEFTSWVPLVSKVCPSDVYRVWKSGSKLRVDTTLLGFEHMSWQKGRRSYIFKGGDEGAVVMELDHEKQVVYTETLSLSLQDPELLLSAVEPSEESVAQRLTAPIVSTHLDTKNIAFERNKSGIWGWRSEKSEAISGYEAKVYSATNVELVTRSRTEHLSDQDKNRSKGSKTPLQSFLGIAEQHTAHNGSHVTQCATPTNPTAITPEEYFNPSFNLQCRDIGRPLEITNKIQRFKATLWLCENHPLSLTEQVTPIIDLMAISNAHFAKLRDFITLKLPPGFPVKISIPLFHVLSPQITPSNFCGCDDPVSSLTVSSPAQDSQEPAGGATAGASQGERNTSHTHRGGNETPAAQRVTIWEALTNTRPNSNPPPYEEDSQLERAIQESLSLSLSEGGGRGQGEGVESPTEVPPPVLPLSPASQLSPAPLSSRTSTSAPSVPSVSSFDEQLRIAMEISTREQEERDRKWREEEEEFQRILQLSLTE
ncbi:ankyrin repeat domain-containing protein 13D-like [Polyodon spathula]|uniref:ankyrin repeat domain-containing protein 13D-like n=1 Tax=Polyodon spathula TaxID=7913 RepID=UPI001B7E0D2F|nr:ankyrin repeat domain-containing protein 13D-like [Polyodon spathula]